MLPDDDFINTQYQFAQYIRDPDNTPCPEGIESRRMKIYTELFYNNIDGFVRNNFPVFFSLIEPETWSQLIRQFMVEHQCQTPIFSEIGREFIQYLESNRFQQSAIANRLYPFTLELLWYEYLELMLSIDKAVIDWPEVNEVDDVVLEKVIGISELSQLGQFSYPVHQISADFIPEETDKRDTFLLVYRDREHGIHFTELSMVANMLYQRLLSSDNLTARDVLAQLCDELDFPNKDEFIGAGLSILKDWILKDIVFLRETK